MTLSAHTYASAPIGSFFVTFDVQTTSVTSTLFTLQ
jgi:hypothetical protein